MAPSFADVLLDVAQGRVSIDEAEAALSTRAEFSFGTNPAWINWHKPLAADFTVPLAVEDVRRGLKRFLAKEWTRRDLHLWAEFIDLVGAYEFPDPPEHDEDYYGGAWDVIRELSSREANGLATEESVRKQLAELDRYDVRTSR